MSVINLKIDVSKIDKARLFKGEKGLYLDAVLIETPNSQYAEYMIVESISKEERDAGNKGTILGSGKVFKQADAQQESKPSNNEAPPPGEDNDPLPF